MEENNHKIPESVLHAIENAQKAYSGVLEILGHNLSEINFPKFNLPESPKLEGFRYTSPEVGAWERHKQNLDIQKNILEIQSSLLNEQRGNTKLTKIILLLTICTTFIAIASLVISMINI